MIVEILGTETFAHGWERRDVPFGATNIDFRVRSSAADNDEPVLKN